MLRSSSAPNSSTLRIQAVSTNTICTQNTELEKRGAEPTNFLGKKIREKALREEGRSGQTDGQGPDHLESLKELGFYFECDGKTFTHLRG